MKNHVAIVLDSSGSMASYAHAVVTSFNSSVDAIRSAALKEKQTTSVSFWTFGELGKGICRKFFHKPVDTLKPLAHHEYRPHGNTPLFDAVAETINELSELPDADDKKTSFLVLVKTDEAENGSVRYTASTLCNLMRKVNATDRWTIAFLVPPGAKRNFCAQFDFPEGNVREWEGTTRGVENASRATASGVGRYFATRSAGIGSTKSFYSDLSDVKPSTVRRSLDDIAGDVKVWNVPAEIGISEFVENRSKRPYRSRLLIGLIQV